MNLLIHICCGPCLFYPMTVIKKEGFSAQGFFFNPNIHPFREYERRVEALMSVSKKFSLPITWSEEGYDIDRWFEAIGPNRDTLNRCPECYRMRIEATAKEAARQKADAFTTTLLYSRYQRHDLIAETGRHFASEYGVEFWYHDFREGWQQGIDMAIEAGIYRQPYCGCIFSERERYTNREKRLARALSRKNGAKSKEEKS